MMHSALIVAVIALVTALIRFAPFLLFPQDRELPAIVTKLSSLLPSAVIGMLVVYCLKGVKLLSSPHGIPELVSCAFVVLLHVWKRNTLLSILGGTVLYMILLQLVFFRLPAGGREEEQRNGGAFSHADKIQEK